MHKRRPSAADGETLGGGWEPPDGCVVLICITMTILTMPFLQICRKLSLLYLARYPQGVTSTCRSLTLSFVVFKFMFVPPTWNSAKVKVVASHRLALPAAARKMAHEESVTSITPPQSYMCKYVEVERSRYRSAECLAQYCILSSIRMVLSAKLKIHRHVN